MRTWHLVLLTIVVAGCSTGGAWRRVETPHFNLQTDLGSKDAHEAGLALEATRDALISAAWPRFPFKNDEKTYVYVLANGIDFERYFGRRTAGLFFHSSPPTVFLYGSADRWELRRSSHNPVTSILRHEMAHQLASVVYGRQPRWFSEGLAQFLEVAYYSEDGRSIVLGGVNVDAYRGYNAVRPITLRDALSWDKGLAKLSDREAQGLYGTSWFFVHWLYNTRPDALGRFEDELGRGTEPSRAFEIAFPGFDPDKGNRELFEYQRHGQFSVMELPLLEAKISADSLHEQLLNPDEVNDVREELSEASKRHSGKGHSALENGQTCGLAISELGL
jgi:hypothetical protein